MSSIIFVCYNLSQSVCPRVEAFTTEAMANEWVEHMKGYPGMKEGWVVMPTDLNEQTAVPAAPTHM